jgi:preprotein translocase subunit SecG
MITILLTIHIMICLFLIVMVLLQSGGKGAQMGAVFGGSSQTVFGSRGAATFLSKATTITAIIFMLTSLTLAVIKTETPSVIEQLPATQERAVPLPGTPQQIPQTPITR